MAFWAAFAVVGTLVIALFVFTPEGPQRHPPMASVPAPTSTSAWPDPPAMAPALASEVVPRPLEVGSPSPLPSPAPPCARTPSVRQGADLSKAFDEAQASVLQMVKKMSVSPNLHQRAVATALLHQAQESDRNMTLFAVLERCGNDDRCKGKAFVEARNQVPPSQDIEALAALAAQGTDLMVYALAAQQCQWSSRAACGSVSQAHRASREPDNAAAWVAVASIAHPTLDTAAVDEALYRLSLATHYNDHSREMLSALHAFRPADADAGLGVCAAEPGSS